MKHKKCAPFRTWTWDPLINSQMLWPTELRRLHNVIELSFCGCKNTAFSDIDNNFRTKFFKYFISTWKSVRIFLWLMDFPFGNGACYVAKVWWFETYEVGKCYYPLRGNLKIQFPFLKEMLCIRRSLSLFSYLCTNFESWITTDAINYRDN